MPGSLTVRQAQLVLPDRVVTGDLVIEAGVITRIEPRVEREAGEVIDGTGLTVLPGVIDPAVHFREPGSTHQECLETGSCAAAAGGVTAFLDLPDTTPATTTVEALHHKLELASEHSRVHYGFYLGATADNQEQLEEVERCAGVAVHLGEAHPDLALTDPDALDAIFAVSTRLLSVHAEDGERLARRRASFQGEPVPAAHNTIHDVGSALAATRRVVELSQRHGRRVHLRHLSSADELDFLASAPSDRISADLCPHHLVLDAQTAYARLGTRAQSDPPIRSTRHQASMWTHLATGTVTCLATDHSPWTADEKSAPFPDAPSGLPGVEWALPVMLDCVARGAATLEQVVQWMCEGPARCFRIPRKGRLEVGFDGDVVLVDLARRRTVADGAVWTRCGWSPYHGETLTGWPVLTAVLGMPVFRDGEIVEGVRGRELSFAR